MTYTIDLYYGDIKFTSDYAHVLDFQNKEQRDAYFDNLDHITIDNIAYNQVSLNGDSVKITFDGLVSEFERVNYIRIKSQLFTEEGQRDTITYYFVNGFRIISSSENLTVIEFNIQMDIWMNYQFDITFHECNVERSHMDRFTKIDDTKYRTSFKQPCYDAVQCNMDFDFIYTLESEMKCKFFGEHEGEGEYPYYLAVITYTTSNKSDDGGYQKQLFVPIVVSSDVTQKYVASSFTFVPQGGEPLYYTCYFPSLKQCVNGQMQTILNDQGIPGSALLSCYIVTSGVELKYERYETRNPYEYATASHYVYSMNGIELTYQKDFYTDPPSNDTPNETKDYGAQFYNPNYETDRDTQFISFSKRFEVPLNDLQVPTDGQDYSDQFEPMLWSNPVRKYYVMDTLSQSFQEIPDYLIIHKDTEYEVNQTLKQIVNTQFLNDINQASIVYQLGDSILPTPNGAIHNLMEIPMTDVTIVNDMWKQYCLTQRNSDRMMMFANILTGGIQEQGSTAVSQGIGYRSNMERQLALENQQSFYSQGSSLALKDQQMYKNMQAQAMRFSAIGGVQAFTQNAIGSIASQMAKEKQIRNQPQALIQAGTFNSALFIGGLTRSIVRLRCDDNAYEEYKRIFCQYGYAIGQVIMPNYKSRKYFNYIKTNGAVITGNLNQEILARLQTIFDKGVTVWHMDYTTYNTLYDYSKENIERSLI